jgi:predicted dehydrogenase
MLRAGVIGTGHLGANHARIYHELENVELYGIAETDAGRAGDIARRFSCRNYRDFHDLCPHVDLVSIAVPTSDHHEVALACLEQGCHVLVEKPITSTVEEAKEIVQMAERKGKVLQVGHIERFNPAIVALENIVREPQFIESHRLSPFQSRGIDVAVVLDLMIHDIDIILNFVDSELESVAAVGVPVLSSRIDIANARLKFKNGCTANVTASRVSKERMRKIRFFQHNAYISVDYAAGALEIVRKTKPTDRNSVPSPEKVHAAEFITHYKTSPMLYEPLKLELELFLKSIEAGIPPIVSGEDGLRALEVAVLILQQLESPGVEENSPE